jgi:hypothetical protein
VQAIRLLDDRMCGRAAEHDLLHGAENHTPSVHAVLQFLAALIGGLGWVALVG